MRGMNARRACRFQLMPRTAYPLVYAQQLKDRASANEWIVYHDNTFYRIKAPAHSKPGSWVAVVFATTEDKETKEYMQMPTTTTTASGSNDKNPNLLFQMYTHVVHRLFVERREQCCGNEQNVDAWLRETAYACVQ